MDPNSIDKTKLRKSMNSNFSIDDIKVICFDLNIDFDNLDGNTKQTKIINLIRHCQNHTRLNDLINKLQQERPYTAWEKLATPPSSQQIPKKSKPKSNPKERPRIASERLATHPSNQPTLKRRKTRSNLMAWINNLSSNEKVALIGFAGVLMTVFFSPFVKGFANKVFQLTPTVVVTTVSIEIPTSTHTLTPTNPPTSIISSPTYTVTLASINIPTSTPTNPPTPIMLSPTYAPTSKPTSIPTITPTPVPSIENTRIRFSDEAVMVYVPAGEFIMGSNKDGDELPIHAVYLDSYWIDKMEVTNGMYTTCVEDEVCTQPSDLSSYTYDNYYLRSTYADYPVVYVNWNDAVDYCVWAGGRLPTEAEWEKAARWDEEMQEARTYPWGETIDCNQANYTSSCVGDTTAVGSYPNYASPYGTLDMAGNVWEWVSDVYDPDYYERLIYDNPTGPLSGSVMVFRGGSWNITNNLARSAFRNADDPTTTGYGLGFRCAQQE